MTALLSADDFSSQDNLDDPEAGWDATLTGEEEEEFFELQIVKHHDGEVRQRSPGEQVRSSSLALPCRELRCQQEKGKL